MRLADVSSQFDQNIGILLTDAVGRIISKHIRKRQTNIVADALNFIVRNHLSEISVDEVGQVLSLFDTSAGGRANVKAHKTGINSWKKVLSDYDQQEQRTGDHHSHRAQR